MSSHRRPRSVRARRAQRRVLARRGNTLVWWSVAFCILGSIAAVFVPAFFERVELSRTAEPARMLQQMHLGASAYFAAPQRIQGVEERRCLPPHAGPSPREPRIEALTYDFFDESEPDATTWSVMSFRTDRPVRFAYRFEPVESGCDLHTPDHTYLVTYSARGDLDGDGVQSLFERRDAASNQDDTLVPVGILYSRDRSE